MSVWRHVRAIGLLPVMATVVVPTAILVGARDQVHVGWGLPPGVAVLPVLVGAALIGTGLLLMVRTVSLLATLGEGTLAPWDPTSRLVVEGPYRHVRNPMISGVLFILLGETALFGSTQLLTWAVLFFVVNAIYMPLVEERALLARFGAEYDEYRANVPRWLPRLHAWQGPADLQS